LLSKKFNLKYMEHQNNKGLVSGLKPKSAFRLGMLSSLVVVFIIGFFVLLGMFIKKDNNSITGGIKNNAVAKNTEQAAIQGDSGIAIQPVSDDDWIKGDKNAPISIIEFSDIDCPFCQRFHETMQQVVDEYDGQVNWVYRHFPLASLHPNASKKSEATECVGELGGNDKFWQYLDKLFAESTPVADLATSASSIGINQDDFQECLDSGRHTAKVKDHINQAQAAGGRGTPHSIIVVDGQTVPIQGAQPFAQIQQMLDGLLN
jgi:protein-disulfide isomerase